MGSIDEVTWQVLTVLLTLLGLVGSVLLWRARGPASGLRGVAWSLLPVAFLLTGTWRLVWEIGDAVSSWAVRFVFSPVVWLGIAVAGTSVALFFVAARLRTRGHGATSGRSRRTSKLESGQGAASLPPAGSKPAATLQNKSVDDDMAEIEAILKKRGIS